MSDRFNQRFDECIRREASSWRERFALSDEEVIVHADAIASSIGDDVDPADVRRVISAS